MESVAPEAGGGGSADRSLADLRLELLERVARAVPAGDRLCFRLACRSWAAAGVGVAAAAPGERPLGPGKVTRMRGPDAAASVARAEMALAALEGPAQSEFESGLCAYAAMNGHLEVLQWARAHGCPWNTSTCAEAAENGHLEVLQWARAHGCPWGEDTCAYAAEGGHLEVLKWARAHGCPWCWMTCAGWRVDDFPEVRKWVL